MSDVVYSITMYRSARDPGYRPKILAALAEHGAPPEWADAVAGLIDSAGWPLNYAITSLASACTDYASAAPPVPGDQNER